MLFGARSSGILLHPTSLPGPFGAGDLGGAASVLDFCRRSGQSVWQMLPVHPPDDFASPYRSPSCFAGHADLIDLEDLASRGWLTRRDLDAETTKSRARADFAHSRDARERLLRRAHARFDSVRASAAMARFKRRAGYWLPDWTLFRALKDEQGGAEWSAWPAELRDREPRALKAARRRLAGAIRYHEFAQYVFDLQWTALREHASRAGLRLLGDLSLFASPDSADCWAHRELFSLDPTGRATHEAGTPPDAFTKEGQRWGVPIYRNAAHARERFEWWLRRVQRELELFDGLRLDHFIGYVRTYAVPLGGRRRGKYVKGPGRRLFRMLERELGELPFCVEDLGDAGDDVFALRDSLGLPGLRVAQFGFEGGADNPHLPHVYEPNVVAYSGTHDNATTEGWFRALGKRRGGGDLQRKVRDYVGAPTRPLHWALVRTLFTSVAGTVIVPAQDLLGLGAAARMNVPGRAHGNWAFRLLPGQLGPRTAERLRRLAEVSGRIRAEDESIHP